jgi:hypothetical protein
LPFHWKKLVRELISKLILLKLIQTDPGNEQLTLLEPLQGLGLSSFCFGLHLGQDWAQFLTQFLTQFQAQFQAQFLTQFLTQFSTGFRA